MGVGISREQLVEEMRDRWDKKRAVPMCMHLEGSSCACKGQGLEPIVPERKNPEFTMEQLLQMTLVPILSIDVDKRVPPYRLKRYCREIIKHARKVAREWVQGSKPVLPQLNYVACIELFRNVFPAVDAVKLCFDLRSLYCKGVLVRNTFYELRLSDEKILFVEGSEALGCKESYDGMLGSHNPPLELSEYEFSRAYDSFIRLGAGALNARKREAAKKIGILSLTLFEPSRQTKMMENVCSGEPDCKVYFKMDEEAWQVVHSWGHRSKRAKGIDYKNNEVVERLSQSEKFDSIGKLNLANSTRLLHVKKGDADWKLEVDFSASAYRSEEEQEVDFSASAYRSEEEQEVRK